jgi:hypothetical protein
MPYPKIDASQLKVFPLKQRLSYLKIEKEAQDPCAPAPDAGKYNQNLDELAERIRKARRQNAAVMLAYGAHLVKNGGGPLVRALIDSGHLTHVATNGAGVIHDWEFCFQGISSEVVRENAPVGRFGAWDETGRWLNLAVLAGAAEGLGFGEAVGKLVVEDGLTLPSPEELHKKIAAAPEDELAGAWADLLWTMKKFGLRSGRHEVKHPYKKYSILAGAYERRVPLTVHPGIGYDIIANHPLFNGGAIGRSATTDARVFAQSVKNLSGGVYISVGSAIMSPQVFEKAFSAANNLRESEGLPFIRGHYIAVVDIQPGNWDWRQGEPPKNNPAFYQRFCKTFARMAGEMEYFECDNLVFVGGLAARLK